MSLFKYKPDKIKYRDNITTLDETHRKIIGDFERNRRLLSTTKKKLEELQNEYTMLNDKPVGTITINDVRRKGMLKDEIFRLNEEINDAENNISEIDYYSKIDDVLLKYYDIVGKVDRGIDPPNKDKPIVSTEPESPLDTLNKLNKKSRKTRKPSRKRMRSSKTHESKDILCFFGNASVDQSKSKIEPNDENKKVIVEKSNKNRATLFDEYMKLINNNYTKRTIQYAKNIKLCEKCHCEKTLIHSEGMYVCRNCGEVEYVVVESEVPNYKESTTDKPQYPYKRVNHLIE